MILPDFARITEENHVPAFASYAVDHAPLLPTCRILACTVAAATGLLDIIAIAGLRRDLRLQVLGEIAVYGRKKADWLQTFLELHGGLPSKDTFRRVFSSDQAGCLPDRVFGGWMQAFWATTLGVKQIAIDGKTVRRSHDRGGGEVGLAPGECLGDSQPSDPGPGGGQRQVE